MTALALAVAETRLILRDRTVLLTAAILPLLLAVLISRSGIAATAGAPGALAAVQLAMLQLFGLYTTTTMTLAARRQQRYLQRLRTSPASTASIVTGLAAPLVLIVLAQAAIVLAATGWATDSAPVRLDLLVLAFANGAATAVALGFLTASFTKSPEAAQITVLPGMLVIVFGVFAALTPAGETVALLRSAVPGAALAELTRLAWDGPEPGTALLAALARPLAVSLAVAAALSYLAARLFRWRPRS
ncbi:ABC transporter permease [Glycomyces paridis]|uniref:ABC transporter permease n=1 Tax=Glycomyces paridis TaxID=2126555 RepID=A0A4S8P8M4_9ACTN|nr:ABC transporter permease [Glycomyces paridis]THV26550.1 ABC transporter permease [Glycomyces paridis]